VEHRLVTKQIREKRAHPFAVGLAEQPLKVDRVSE
jgi:hypothetical protein